ncbi:MAG TPA: WhiB family transcriptional regulator [Jiangellaceae bacterium]
MTTQQLDRTSDLDQIAAELDTIDEPYTARNWRDGALCAQTDPETYFPAKGGHAKTAKHTCLSCQVRVFCLDWALEHDERFGVWGGLSENQRRNLRRARRTNPTTDTATTEVTA